MRKVLNRNPHSFQLRAFAFLRHSFIPHRGNNHWPHALRPKKLFAYGTGLLLLKLAVTLMLFITYPNPGFFSKEQIEKIFELTNAARHAQSLPPLKVDPYLTKVAEARARDMAEKQYFSHYTPEGYAPWYFIDTGAYDYAYAGENLAMNFTEMESVQRGFMASLSHRENILNPKFLDVGFAVTQASINGKNTHILVEIFGAKKEKVALTLLPSSTRSETLPGNVEHTPTSTPPTIAGTETAVQPYYHFPKELLVFPTLAEHESLAVTLYRYSHLAFLAFVLLFVVSLFINILVKVHIQHHPLLFKSALLVGFILILVATKIHFLEGIPPGTFVY